MLSVIYESQQGYYDVALIKRGVGSLDLQSAIKGIESQDAGFLVQNGQIMLCPQGCSYCVNPSTC